MAATSYLQILQTTNQWAVNSVRNKPLTNNHPTLRQASVIACLPCSAAHGILMCSTVKASLSVTTRSLLKVTYRQQKQHYEIHLYYECQPYNWFWRAIDKASNKPTQKSIGNHLIAFKLVSHRCSSTIQCISYPYQSQPTANTSSIQQHGITHTSCQLTIKSAVNVLTTPCSSHQQLDSEKDAYHKQHVKLSIWHEIER